MRSQDLIYASYAIPARYKTDNAPMLRFQSFHSASKILKRIEALNMVKKE
jgi:transposase-like protein